MAGLEHLLSVMEREHLQTKWRGESRKLAELSPSDDEARELVQDALKTLQRALDLVEDREERKKTRDESG
jgi:CelD/BcsL family acetyltransferase involved in cellulose biosynthesis